jgi:4-amino-4-deoxy-L-arabinose transferase-like glycosyltransferase
LPLDDYVIGFAFFAATIGGVCVAATIALRRRFPALQGAPRVVAWAILATFVLITVHVVTLALGVLSRGTVVGATALSVLAAWRLRPVAGTPERSPEPAGTDARASLLLAGLTAAGLAVYLVALLRSELFVAPTGIDALTFHFPNVARWIQSGSLWQIDQFVPAQFHGNYPNNGDVVLLAAVLPWRNEFLAHLAMAPYLAVVAVAVYALGRELRATPAAAVAISAVLTSIPVMFVPVVSVLVDPVVVSMFAAGVLFLIRHARTQRQSELALAGLALGISFGTKWYGASAVAVVVLVWAAAALLGGSRPAVVARRGAALCGLIALAGGVWLLRNLVESGNPVMPLEVAPFGLTIFDAPRDVVREHVGFSIADYLGQPHVWTRYLLPQFRDFLGLSGIGLTLAIPALAGLLIVWRRQQLPRKRLAVLGTVCAAILVAVYVATPYSALGPTGTPGLAGANSRYVLPALVVSAALTAWAVHQLRGSAILFQLGAAVAVLDGLIAAGRIGVRLRALDVVFAIVALAVAAVVAAGFLRLRGRAPLRRRMSIAVAVGLVAATLPLGYLTQSRYNSHRFQGQDAAIEWLVDNAHGGLKIGLTGTWPSTGIPPVYPSFGERLGNEVAYVGPFTEGRLRAYHREAAFVAAVQRERYDYLVVGLGNPPRPHVTQESWARAAGYVPVAESDRLAVFGQAGAASRMSSRS